MQNAAPHKLNYVNAVRGIAILMVGIVHVLNAVKGLPHPLRYISSKGVYGVQLFFVASAFTLFLSYRNRVQKEGANTNRNFFTRRFFRISPMYYLAAIVYCIVCYYVPRYNDGNPLVWWKVLANILYLNAFIPGTINYLPPGGWSVGVEMIFYCCLPFLFKRIKNIKAAVIWFTVLAIGSIVLKLVIRVVLTHRGIDYHRPENWFLYFWFPNQAPVFLLGIVLFFAIEKYHIKSKANAIALITISTVLLALFTAFQHYFNASRLIPEHIVVAMFFTVNVYCMSQHTIKIFDNVITRFLGEISFSIYLVHFLVIYVLVDYMPAPANPYAHVIVLLIATLAISGAISKLTYHFIELPGVALGNKYIKRRAEKSELNPAI